MNTDPLVDHVESTVGRIEEGWRHERSASDIVVVRTRDRPHEGASTYITLGVSHHLLAMSADRDVRQELIFAVDDSFDGERVASFLQTFAEFVVGNHRALLRGHVIGPDEPVIPDVRLNAVYTAIPVLHDKRLRTFHATEPPTVFAWIVPISEVEARYAREHGWEAFEERLEAAAVDLCDLERDSVV